MQRRETVGAVRSRSRGRWPSRPSLAAALDSDPCAPPPGREQPQDVTDLERGPAPETRQRRIVKTIAMPRREWG